MTETKTQHTPGPWRVYGEGDNVKCGKGISVADVCRRSCNGASVQCDEGYANARLIAAAPQLLEAIQEISRIVEQTMCGNLTGTQAIELIDPILRNSRAAITAAE